MNSEEHKNIYSEEYVNQEKDWLKKKIRLQRGSGELYFKEREVWYIALGFNVGSEINGRGENFERPGLVVKKISDKTALVLPITSSVRVGSYHQIPFVNHDGQENALALSQIRVVDTKRFIRKVRNANFNPDLFAQVKRHLSEYLNIN